MFYLNSLGGSRVGFGNLVIGFLLEYGYRRIQFFGVAENLFESHWISFNMS